MFGLTISPCIEVSFFKAATVDVKVISLVLDTLPLNKLKTVPLGIAWVTALIVKVTCEPDAGDCDPLTVNCKVWLLPIWNLPKSLEVNVNVTGLIVAVALADIIKLVASIILIIVVFPGISEFELDTPIPILIIEVVSIETVLDPLLIIQVELVISSSINLIPII